MFQLFLEKGKIKVELGGMSRNNPKTILDNYNEKFNDGRWHPAMLTISTNNLVLTVDNRPMRTTRLLSMQTGPVYMIGGTYWLTQVYSLMITYYILFYLYWSI